MEGTRHKDAFDVVLVLPDGRTKIYAQYYRDGTSREMP